jgi:hypothetical protein
MSKKRKSYGEDFKQNEVSRMAEAKTITGLAKELGVRREGFVDRRRFRGPVTDLLVTDLHRSSAGNRYRVTEVAPAPEMSGSASGQGFIVWVQCL